LYETKVVVISWFQIENIFFIKMTKLKFLKDNKNTKRMK